MFICTYNVLKYREFNLIRAKYFTHLALFKAQLETICLKVFLLACCIKTISKQCEPPSPI